MTCHDMEVLIISSASAISTSPEAAAHIAGCESCERLVRELEKGGQASQPSLEQLDRIKAMLLADLNPVKPLPPARMLVFALMFILVVIAAIGGAELGIAGWRALSLLQKSAVFTALAGGASVLACATARLMVPGTRLTLSPYLYVFGAFGLMTAICIILFDPQDESTFVSTGLVCLRIGIECAVSATVLFWLLLRRGSILNPMLMGATAGLLAGLSGLAVLELFCPNLNEYHILVWHLGSVLVSAIGGLAIGTIAEYSSWRRVPRSEWIG
jgi:hypothetical protein